MILEKLLLLSGKVLFLFLSHEDESLHFPFFFFCTLIFLGSFAFTCVIPNIGFRGMREVQRTNVSVCISFYVGITSFVCRL